jgi:hypothetical protein
MGKQRRSVTPEFKQEAVDLCRHSGKSECQPAADLETTRHGPTWDRGGELFAPGVAATRPNEKVAGAFTYVPRRQSWLYSETSIGPLLRILWEHAKTAASSSPCQPPLSLIGPWTNTFSLVT